LLGLDLLRIVDTSTSEGITVERLTDDSTLAMVARARVHYAGQPVGVLEGAILLDAAYVARLRETSGIDLTLSAPNGRPATAGASFLTRTTPLAIGPPPHPQFSGSISTAASDRTIATLQWSAALLGVLGLALAIALALAWSSQISRPVEQIAAFSDRIARGEWDQPLKLDSVRELQALVASLERMRADLQSQRDRLATSERQAAWGQMARKVAHEVRNPLTPIAVSIADLKRSYDLGRPEFPQILDQAVRTIGEEVETLKRLLQEFADFGRLPAPVLAPCRVSDLFADLETLYADEIGAGRLAVTHPACGMELSADAGQLRQALVNLVKNGLEALNGDGRVTLAAEARDGVVEIAVADTGPGLTEAQRANLFVPGFTTKAKGSGLGLTIVERIVNDHRGTIAVASAEGRGTTVRLKLPLDRASETPRI
jgi:nitrogen fixation/metabolism regulation signal transduction histidine kinase